jgi:uncharacterized protein with von Willebrand factor type A (vWA) domain
VSATDRPPDGLRTELVRFVRALRRDGASVPANAATTAARSLAAVGLGDRARVRTALRASLLADSDDFEAFDRLFGEFWHRITRGADGTDGPAATEDDPGDGIVPPGSRNVDDDPEADGDGRDGDREAGQSLGGSVAGTAADGDGDGDDGTTTTALYSPTGAGGAVESGVSVGDELGAAFRELTRALAGLEGRQHRPGTDRADVRRALRTSVNTGGVVVPVPRRERRRTAVSALVLVDVSRSVIDALDRAFLVDFLRLARSEWRDVRVFFFDEDIREVTEDVDAPSATAAMEALEDAGTEWGGGTRIGGSLAGLHGTAPDAVDRRTVTFVVSDGLEMGDVSDLERELSRLSRRASRVLWLNPLAASPSYEPAARGMAAALPYIDGLFAFAGAADVAELARQLRRQGPGGRIGHEFDPRTDPKTNRRTTLQTTNDP